MSFTDPLNQQQRRVSTRLLAVSLTFAVAAGITYTVLRAEFGDRPAHVNVRWSPAVTPDVQSQLEQNYHLTSPQRTEGRTFSYDLTDLSRGNIRTMVLDPAVEDTHYIHRTAYRIWRFAPRSQYPGAGKVWGPLLEATIVGFVLLAGIAFALAVAEQLLPRRIVERLPLRYAFIRPRDAAASLVGAISDRIPPGSPEQVALFRIAFGLALLALFLSQPVAPVAVLQSTNALTPLHQWLVAPFARAPQATLWVLPWLLLWSVLFIAGVASRLSYLMLTVGAYAWATLVTTRLSYHMVSALLMALLCLIPSRWGDAWSADAWWRSRTGSARRPVKIAKEYGYTIWIPGVVIGVIFAAAAVAKLRQSGIAWILNGTVKYHFLSDAAAAPVDWGLRVGLHPTMAVALSLGAIVIELAIVFGAFARTYAYRAVAGIAALALLSGFALFQGLFWPAWWVLLISFLPWHRLMPPQATPSADRGPVGHTRFALQPIIVIAFIAQQLLVSGLTLEAGPAFSTYGMYSNTYDSPAAYEAQSATSYWLIASDGRQCTVSETAARTVATARNGPDAASALDAAQRCFAITDLRDIHAEQRRKKIDWARWRPAGETRVPMVASTSAP